MSEDIEDLFVGALLGGAIGDALGSFCEGWSREQILAVADLTGCFRDRLDRTGAVGYPAGTHTDDTQQTLVLAESILCCGKVNAEDLARRFLDMWRSGTLFLYGRAFRETMARLDSGVSWEAAASADQPSNGTVMKIAPVGLWHWAEGEAIREAALAASSVTHRDPRAVAPAVAIAHVVGHLVTHRPLDTDEVVSVAEWSARPIHAATGDLLGQVKDLLTMPGEAASLAMLEMAEEASADRIPGEAPMTAVVALEAFLRTPTDYDASVCRALQAGGDVDTFAAVTGNLAGLYNGMAGLPQSLVADLLERDRIEGLARALYQKTIGR